MNLKLIAIAGSILAALSVAAVWASSSTNILDLVVGSSDGAHPQLRVERHPGQVGNLIEVVWGKSNWFRLNSDGDMSLGPGFNRSQSNNNHQIFSIEPRWIDKYSLLELNGTNRARGTYETIGQIVWNYQNSLGEWEFVGFIEMMEDESGEGSAAFAVYTKDDSDPFLVPSLYIAGDGEIRVRDGTRTLLPVTYGLPDSCGVGFRCMKIPN